MKKNTKERQLRLKLVNWGICSEPHYQAIRKAARSGHLDPRKAFHYIVQRGGLEYHPAATQFGEAILASLILENRLKFFTQNDATPSPDQVAGLLENTPELRKYYRLKKSKTDWWLTFRSEKSGREAPQWNQRAWRLLFQIGVDRWAEFKVPEGEFLNVLGFFPNISEAATKGSRTLLRLWKFLNRHHLLEAPAPVANRHPSASAELRILSHASAAFRSGNREVWVDPSVIASDPRGTNSHVEWRLALSRVENLSAIWISHHHWDHFHLPTLARIPRKTPIYVPVVKKTSLFNPDIAVLLRSLGFENVHPIRHWKSVRFGDIEVTALPFYGEWFGPDSDFDGNTYAVRMAGKTVFSTVDSNRNSAGKMSDIFPKIKKTLGAIDYFLCSLSGQEHDPQLFAGTPFRYSSEFPKKFSAWMQYHPNAETTASWCKILRPRYAIPHAEFVYEEKQTGRWKGMKAKAAIVQKQIGRNRTKVYLTLPGRRIKL